MRINLLKSRQSLEQSSNLALLGKKIVTNTRNSLVVLNHNLANVGRVGIPVKDFWINASYIESDQKSAIFAHNDDVNRLLYFDAFNQEMSIIRGKDLKRVCYFYKHYSWIDGYCAIVVQLEETHEHCLLLVDSQTLATRLIPVAECKDIFKFYQKIIQYKDYCFLSFQEKFLAFSDYYGEQTLKFVNTDTDKSRIISIKKELNEGKKYKDGRYWPEFTPHAMYYQDEWIVLVWEARVVVISPTGKRQTINEIKTFRFGYVRILFTSKESIKFVVSLETATEFVMLFLLSKPGRLSSLLQIYEVFET